MERIEKFIGVHFKVGACNLRCSYCYLGKHENKLLDIPYSLENIRKAFSKERLGGICYINICSDGETLIHPMMPEIIKMFLLEGHYVLVVTNAILTNRLKECIELNPYADKLFFKVSFHYEEMKHLGVLEKFFNNLEMSCRNSTVALNNSLFFVVADKPIYLLPASTPRLTGCL